MAEEPVNENIREVRWWSAAEVVAGAALFTPRDLPRLLDHVLTMGPPPEPIVIDGFCPDPRPRIAAARPLSRRYDSEDAVHIVPLETVLAPCREWTPRRPRRADQGPYPRRIDATVFEEITAELDVAMGLGGPLGWSLETLLLTGAANGGKRASRMVPRGAAPCFLPTAA